MLATLARRNEQLHLVGEDQQADAVVVGGGREAEHGGQLGCQFTLELLHRPEVLRGAGINDQHDRQLALLDVAFHVYLAGAGGHVPVDGADLVAGLVGTNFLELHAPPLENRVVLASKAVGNQPLGADLDMADFLHQVVA